MPLRIVPFGVLVLILLEIAAFIVVGRAIGVLATLALVILAAIVGVVLMRRQGFAILARIRDDAETGRLPGRALADGAAVIVAGILLIIPGFVSDVLGLLLFVPGVRDFLWRLVMPAFAAGAAGMMRGGRFYGQPAIDLERLPDDRPR